MNNFRRVSSKIQRTESASRCWRKSEGSDRRLLIAFVLVFAVAFAPLTYAQFVGFPIGPTQPTSPFNNARTSAVSLPFFDDFSLVTNGRLDPSLWQAGGGTYVSNTITINHPTLNVVTFDGSDRTGRPYNFVTQSAQGAGDTLTSQPIDLLGLSVTDSVYFSFYWQLRGLGELPDADDSLRVQFLTDKGVWQTVWKQAGGKQDNNFNYAQLIVRDPAYFHAGFQFRFQGYNRLSGQFDMWHIDYVYLNKGRRTADRFVRDVAFRLPVSSFLKRYTAMPLKQYLANPTAETADSIGTDIRNLFNVFNFTTFGYTLRDEISGRTFQNFQQSSSELISSLSPQLKSLKPTAISGVDTSAVKKLSLVSHFQILTTDNVNPSIPGVDLRRNDSISGKTVLDDYYAYDDGTAETAVYFNRSLGRTAVRYFLNTPDFVSGVRMNIVSTLKDLTGQSMTLQVWSNGNGKPQSLLYQKAFKVQYPINRNEFVEFPFDFGVAVRDTFYIGWLQIGQDGVPVGLDRNNQHENQIFINAGQEWVPYTNFKNDPNLAYFQGSLLVRPVMGAKKGTPITSVEPEQQLDWEVYPNPTNGQVRWQTDEIRQVEVYQLNGVLLKQQSVQPSENTLDLSGFADGLYFLRLSNEKKTLTKKILLRK